MTCVFFLAKEKSRPGDSSQRPPKNGLNGEGGLGGLTVDGADPFFDPPKMVGLYNVLRDCWGSVRVGMTLSLLYTAGRSRGVSFRLHRRSRLTTKNLQSIPASRVILVPVFSQSIDMNVCFGDALILAVHSCPAWPRDKDLPNVPTQADDLQKVFQDLGLSVTRPEQEALTQEGVQLCVSDLCRRTSCKLLTIEEDVLFVSVAVLSHGRLSDSFSELPAMVCYDSLGVLDASNDADLDGILLSGFNSIEVPVGKRLKVWLILDCCQSNEHISTWRGPATNLGMKRLRRTFGCPSSVDFMTLLSCDPGRESSDIYSMSRALAEVLEPKKPILLRIACESAMNSVEGWSCGTVRPSLRQRGNFSSLHLFNHEADTSTKHAVIRYWVALFFWLLFSHVPMWPECLACPLTMHYFWVCGLVAFYSQRLLLFYIYCKAEGSWTWDRLKQNVERVWWTIDENLDREQKDRLEIQFFAFYNMWLCFGWLSLYWGIPGSLHELIIFAGLWESWKVCRTSFPRGA